MAADETTANLSSISYSVDITFEKLEHDYDKQLIILSQPKATDGTNETPVTGLDMPLTFNIDIQRLKQIITVTGWLLEETGSSALVKLDQLEAMLSITGNMVLAWKTGGTLISRNGSLVKCKVTEVPGRVGDEHPANQGKSFMIQLQFSVGTYRGG